MRQVFSIQKGSRFASVSSLRYSRRECARLGVLTADGESFSVRRRFVLIGQPPAMRPPVNSAADRSARRFAELHGVSWQPDRHVVRSPYQNQYRSVGSKHT